MNIAKQYPRTIIFFSAFVLRAIVGYIFYGSIDIDAYSDIIATIVAGDPSAFSSWNYFPSISLYLWFSGFLATYSFLPYAFCIKFIPIICDTLLSVLIFEVLSVRGIRNAFHLTMLYVICPVSVFVTSVHGQWESMFLFLLVLSFAIREYAGNTLGWYFLYGLLFGFSILIKPIGVPLLFFLFIPRKGFFKEIKKLGILMKFVAGIILLGMVTIYFFLMHFPKIRLSDIFYMLRLHNQICIIFIVFLLLITIFSLKLFVRIYQENNSEFKLYIKNQLSSVFGLLCAMIFSLFTFHKIGFELLPLLDGIMRYANHGPQGFGLFVGLSFVFSPVAFIFKNRLLLLFGVAVISFFYYQNKIDIFYAIMLTYAFLISLAGLCPNYLIWVVPFALIVNVGWQLVLYVVSVSIFYLIQYNPHSFFEWSFLFNISLAPVKTLKFLTPSVIPYWICSFVYTVFGFILIPLSASFFLLGNASKRKLEKDISYKTNWLKYCYFMFFFTMSILLLMFLSDKNIAARFNDAYVHRYDVYALRQNSSSLVMRSFTLLNDASALILNSVNIIIFWIIVWLLYAIMIFYKKDELLI